MVGAPSAVATWQAGLVTTWQAGLAYGALGLPLAFVALPLYVVLPNHYASSFGVPLATLGALLLAVRALDALSDPWIGRWADRCAAHSPQRLLLTMAGAAVLLVLGFRALFFPPAWAQQHGLLAWCGAALVISCAAYSGLSVAHQAWGARLGGDEAQRARTVAWREGLALLGVLVASVLPALAGLSVTTVVFAGLMAAAMAALWRAPRPAASARTAAAAATGDRLTASPWRSAQFRSLLAVYLFNGVASAVPATLVLFFIRDRLQAAAFEPLFLASYFAAGALSMPLWLRLVARIGLARTWLAGMALAIATFAWAAALGAGDVAAFTGVCLASGLALGADLAVPSALLAGVIQKAGHGGRHEGAYFGWWHLVTKGNLALAAGLALPLLSWLGYQPGSQAPAALQALALVYSLLPCALKLVAAGLLWRWAGPWTPEVRMR
jgi:Na+/melibiose symporter-like transporter